MRLLVSLGTAGFAAALCLVQACSGAGGATPADADAGDPSPTPGSSGSQLPGSSGSSGSPGSSGSSGSSGGLDSGSDAPQEGGDGGKSVMTFFVTSTGSGAEGGNLGGLAGADARCTALAAAAGGGDHTWKAYLSTNTNNGGTKVDAKDRIGPGPWHNQKGTLIASTVAELHGAAFNLKTADVVDEKGAPVPTAAPNRHDILTGSTAQGTALNQNCQNWTSKAANANAFVGHSDSATLATANDKWNSAQQVKGCTQAALVAAGGEGRIYCFATN